MNTTPGIYGPNTEAVQAIIDRIYTLTKDECTRLAAAYDAARDAAGHAAWKAAWGAARNAAFGTAWEAAWGAARDAAWDAAWETAHDAAWEVAWHPTWNATLATVTSDLATEDGPYTIAQRDLLLAPFNQVTA